jgi:hypothetical protein
MEKLTFAERAKRVFAAAVDLQEALNILEEVTPSIEAEAAAMEAAEKRFAAKKEDSVIIR